MFLSGPTRCAAQREGACSHESMHTFSQLEQHAVLLLADLQIGAEELGRLGPRRVPDKVCFNLQGTITEEMETTQAAGHTCFCLRKVPFRV